MLAARKRNAASGFYEGFPLIALIFLAVLPQQMPINVQWATGSTGPLHHSHFAIFPFLHYVSMTQNSRPIS
jgi:hypothetical protein